MPDYHAKLDVAAALAAPQRCPGCGAATLVSEPAGEQARFRCESCGLGWRIELGWMCAVAPTPADEPGWSCESD